MFLTQSQDGTIGFGVQPIHDAVFQPTLVGPNGHSILLSRELLVGEVAMNINIVIDNGDVAWRCTRHGTEQTLMADGGNGLTHNWPDLITIIKPTQKDV